MKSTKIAALVAAVLATGAFTHAAQAETDAATCRTVRFADIGWTDITSTTALASTVFEALGYKPTTTIASVPISFAGLKSKQLDISLGYWWPVQRSSSSRSSTASRSTSSNRRTCRARRRRSRCRATSTRRA